MIDAWVCGHYPKAMSHPPSPPANDPPEVVRPRLLTPVIARSLSMSTTTGVVRVGGVIIDRSLNLHRVVMELHAGHTVEIAASEHEAPFFVFKGLDVRDGGRCPSCTPKHYWGARGVVSEACPWPR